MRRGGEWRHEVVAAAGSMAYADDVDQTLPILRGFPLGGYAKAPVEKSKNNSTSVSHRTNGKCAVAA
jgi:hypothetical protein